jgi:hypothetical protein
LLGAFFFETAVKWLKCREVGGLSIVKVWTL